MANLMSFTAYESVRVYIQIPEANINYQVDDVTNDSYWREWCMGRGGKHQD